MNAKPPLKWVGGKRQLLPQLLALAPKEFKSYHEPFVGGGALYFALNPKEAYLGDFNPRLINVYRQIQTDVQGVITSLRKYTRTKECYYETRSLMNAELPFLTDDNHGIQQSINVGKLDTESAARFIFINKTCYNGLWRENAHGEFNVPYGGDRKGKFYDVSNLMECSIQLRHSAISRCEDFGNVRRAGEDDFVYFDPPYVPVTATSFVDYTAKGFGGPEQLRLRDLALELKRRGVHVMLSNSDSPLVRELYKEFELHEVQARRSVNSNGLGRGKVGELIIR